MESNKLREKIGQISILNKNLKNAHGFSNRCSIVIPHTHCVCKTISPTVSSIRFARA